MFFAEYLYLIKCFTEDVLPKLTLSRWLSIVKCLCALYYSSIIILDRVRLECKFNNSTDIDFRSAIRILLVNCLI